jgi:predicted TIM-barrel fold metal-dependent hydrolase
VTTLINQIGADRLMFGTDFPHIGNYWPHSRYYLELLFKRHSAEEIDAILWGNASDLYRIDLPQAAAATVAA